MFAGAGEVDAGKDGCEARDRVEMERAETAFCCAT